MPDHGNGKGAMGLFTVMLLIYDEMDYNLLS
jgi:hypothetical protein